MKSSYFKRNGHERYRTNHANYNSLAQDRRKSALKRLENQLLTGFKPEVVDGVMTTSPLTEADIKRIKAEIVVLKRKIDMGRNFETL